MKPRPVSKRRRQDIGNKRGNIPCGSSYCWRRVHQSVRSTADCRVAASFLGTVAIKEALRRAKTDAADVDEVLMGQILTAGTGQVRARLRSTRASRLKQRRQVNQLCGSGLRTVAMGSRSSSVTRMSSSPRQESMSQAPHCAHLRNGQKMGDLLHRHHDQRRPVGCLQRLSHGQYGGERGREVSNHPREAG